MPDNFPEKVQNIIGPLMSSLGFKLDGIDDDVDEGGRRGVAVFYRSRDCKMQVYWSSRKFEINAMIAPLEAPNEHGLYNRSSQWHYLTEFIDKPHLSLEEMVKELENNKDHFTSDIAWLTWLRDQIEKQFDNAHARIVASSR